MVLVLLSAQAERFIVSRIQDFQKLGPSGQVVVHMYVVPSPCHFFFKASYWPSDYMSRSKPFIGQHPIFNLYWCFYLQWSRELVSPKCGIFFDLCQFLKQFLTLIVNCLYFSHQNNIFFQISCNVTAATLQKCAF